jgi:hypothetical protein
VAYQQSYDADAIYKAKAAKIVRRGFFTSCAGITVIISSGCQVSSVPSNLVLPIQILLQGPGTARQSNDSYPGCTFCGSAYEVKFYQTCASN